MMLQLAALFLLLCLVVLGLTLEQLRQFDRIQLSRSGHRLTQHVAAQV